VVLVALGACRSSRAPVDAAEGGGDTATVGSTDRTATPGLDVPGAGLLDGAAAAPDRAASDIVVAGDDTRPLGGARTTVVLFLIDGLMSDAAMTAAANGATNLKMVIDEGVRAEVFHSTSPATLVRLPDGALPWGRATSGNVAVHTGCHLFESSQMDDIFLAARAAGIKSVFAGGDANYAPFVNADFHYADNLSDEVVVQRGIDHLRKDGVRLLRLHLQRVRDDWSGPAGKTDPGSAYVKHIVADDLLLGRLIQALKEVGAWDSTYLAVTGDHGMGQTSASGHPPSAASSWDPFLAIRGPNLKKGATIPYAELPDLAVTTARFLGLRALQGHIDPKVTLARRGPTGVVLENLFAGAPAELDHPRLVERYLKENTFPGSGDDFGAYREAMLRFIK
jgi:hypothetical protein